jgi:hypothetical protein
MQVLRPPAGFRLDAAILTTFSLDFVTLAACLLAFSGEDSEEDPDDVLPVAEGRSQSDSLRMLQSALLRLPDRVRIVVNKGGLHASGMGRANRVYSLFSPLVGFVSVAPKRFHPKVFLMRFTSRGGGEQPLLRLVCTSRNLTRGRCWELGVCLEGQPKPAGSRVDPCNEAVAAFLGQVLDASGERGRSERLDALLKEVLRVSFQPIDQAKGDLQFHWQWPGPPAKKSRGGARPLASQLPQKAERGLVLSPFLSTAALKDVLARCCRTQLVTTENALDELQDGEMEDLFRAVENKSLDLRTMRLPETEGAEIEMDLHAKIYSFEGVEDIESYSLLGSANLTASGLRAGNVEAVLSLSPGLKPSSFKDFVERYTDAYTRDRRSRRQERDDLAQARVALGLAREKLGGLRILADYLPADLRLSLRLDDRDPSTETLIRWLAGQDGACFDVRAAPLSIVQDQGALLAFGSACSDALSFEGISLPLLTDFVFVQVAHRQHQDLSACFVLKAESTFRELFEERNRQVLSEKLTSRGAVADLLWNILLTGSARGLRRIPEGGDGSGGGHGDNDDGATLPCLEDLMESCAVDPECRSELLGALALPHVAKALSPQFLRSWEVLNAALDATGRRGKNG